MKTAMFSMPIELFVRFCEWSLAVGSDVWVDVSGDSALDECVTLTYSAPDECWWEEQLTEDEDAGFIHLRGRVEYCAAKLNVRMREFDWEEFACGL